MLTTDKQINRQTDRPRNKQTGQKQYAPDHSIRGHKYVTKGISPLVFYGDLVYKLNRKFKCEFNFVSSGSKLVKRLRRRKYDPVIIERTIGLVLGPSSALYRSFLKHCTLTNKTFGTI